jgi:hypothetical protein
VLATEGVVNAPVITFSLTDVSSDYNALQSPRQQIDIMLDLNVPEIAPQGVVFRSYSLPHHTCWTYAEIDGRCQFQIDPLSIWTAGSDTERFIMGRYVCEWKGAEFIKCVVMYLYRIIILNCRIKEQNLKRVKKDINTFCVTYHRIRSRNFIPEWRRQLTW